MTASVLIDLLRLCFMTLTPPGPPPPTAFNVLKKKNTVPSLPVFVFYIPHSNNNFVKHAKLLKSPARDLGSCASLEPGRCKGREDLCNSGLVLPRVHTHTKRREWKAEGERKEKRKETWALTELITFVSIFKITRADLRVHKYERSRKRTLTLSSMHNKYPSEVWLRKIFWLIKFIQGAL